MNISALIADLRDRRARTLQERDCLPAGGYHAGAAGGQVVAIDRRIGLGDAANRRNASTDRIHFVNQLQKLKRRQGRATETPRVMEFIIVNNLACRGLCGDPCSASIQSSFASNPYLEAPDSDGSPSWSVGFIRKNRMQVLSADHPETISYPMYGDLMRRTNN